MNLLVVRICCLVGDVDRGNMALEDRFDELEDVIDLQDYSQGTLNGMYVACLNFLRIDKRPVAGSGVRSYKGRQLRFYCST